MIKAVDPTMFPACLVLATGNQGKVDELNALLNEPGLQVITQTTLGVESVKETGLTFIENALLKARHAAHCTGLPALADDSGLVVPALGGEPGIFSARYAGEQATDQQNSDRLLEKLSTIPDTLRQAEFHCVLVLLRHAADPVPLVCHGCWHGVIAHQPVGSNGFGYDPIFYLPAQGKTAAELSMAEKQQLSHRGQAFQLLLKALRDHV